MDLSERGSFLCVVILFPAICQETYGYDQGQSFRNSDGQPDSVNPEYDRKRQHYGDLEYQSAQERDGCRYAPVAERGEER